jgi:hypothetical protein
MVVELSQTRHPEPLQSIADHLGAGALADAGPVTWYLDHGFVLIDMMDVERDVLVRHHGVTLPPELLAVIREWQYTVPAVGEERLIALIGDAGTSRSDRRPLPDGRRWVPATLRRWSVGRSWWLWCGPTWLWVKGRSRRRWRMRR